MSSNDYTPVIRDNIEGNRLIDKPNYIKSILDTVEFQRLRNIRQMGLASYVFPPAEHSRFVHSLGVLGTAQYAFRHIRRAASDHNLIMPGLKFDEHTERDFYIAAMCHDLGHTAFSHLLENTLLPHPFLSHEECTVHILNSNTAVARTISDVADVDAVTALIQGTHPNPTLNNLVSGPFDVDRCDYVLRDSAMSGVEYGQFDLKWLIRAISVELNPLGQPVLVLDGARGMDALRQFLSARRYLHRQVYFHRSVRSSQLLMKAILERIQDNGDDRASRALIPKALHSLQKGARPTFSDFLKTTDVEILTAIHSIADSGHKDAVLKHLCEAFITRQIPKCILDTSAMTSPLSEIYGIFDGGADDAGDQQEMWPLLMNKTDVVIEELRGVCNRQLTAMGLPSDLSKYLVRVDTVGFRSSVPSDFRFQFADKIIPFDAIHTDVVGFGMQSLLETFKITRVFVPRNVADAAREHLDEAYRIDNGRAKIS